MTADESSRRALPDLLAQTACRTTPATLLRAALIVSHGAAFSTLAHSQFSWEDTSWGNSHALSSSLIAIYDEPWGQNALFMFRKLWLQAEVTSLPGIGLSMPGPTTWPETDTFQPDTDRKCLLNPGQAQSSADAPLVNTVLSQLISCARDWLGTHPLPDGLALPALHSVTRSAEFARLFLEAVAQAHPGETLCLPDLLAGPSGQASPAALASETRWRVRRALLDDLEFNLLDNQGKQALSERLLLMPIFLAAMYEYGRLAAEPETQDLASELANQYLHEFFGISPYRTHFDSFGLLPLCPNCTEVAYPSLDWWELQDGQFVPSQPDLSLLPRQEFPC